MIAVVIATGNSFAYVGSLAELGTATRPVTLRGPSRQRAEALTVPILIMVSGLAAAALTSIGTEDLVSICAGSQVPVYVMGLAARMRIFPRFRRRWWLSVGSTAAVGLLLIPAGFYLVVPAIIALGVIAALCFRRQNVSRSISR